MNKVHFIWSTVGTGGWRYTACGMAGKLCPNSAVEFDTPNGKRFEAVNEWTSDVTCKRCLRSEPTPMRKRL